jgi:hypothetical protein
VTIDITNCLTAYGPSQRNGDDAVAIEFAGKSAANSVVAGVTVTGASVGIRANRPGGTIDLTNANFTVQCPLACVPIVLYHYTGVNITAKAALVIAKAGSPSAFLASGSLLVYNISDLVSPVDAFAVASYPSLSSVSQLHSSAEKEIVYTLGAIGGLLFVFIVFEVVHKCRHSPPMNDNDDDKRD